MTPHTTQRRVLGEMLAEVASGAMESAVQHGLRTTRMEVTLPVEIGLKGSGDTLQILGDVPRLVTRCAFDNPTSRLSIVWQETAA